MPADPTAAPKSRSPLRKLRIIDLVRPHWKALTIALVAVLGETLTDILEPWPIKIVVDNILQSKKLPAALGGIVTGLFGAERQRGGELRRRRGRGHRDRRRGQLLLREVPDHERQPMGGTRPAADAVPPHPAAVARRTRRVAHRRPDHAGHQRHRARSRTSSTPRCSACSSTCMTLVGMIGVMFYLNWRFTLIALSVVPVLFLVVYSLHAAHQERLARGSKEGRRAALHRRRSADLHPRGQGVRARRLRSSSDSRPKAWPTWKPGLQARSIKAKLSPMVEVIVAVGTCLVLWYGARLAMAGRTQRGRADRLPVVSGEDVQADARSLEDDRHRLQGDGRATSAFRKSWTSKAACATCRARRRHPKFKGRIEFEDVCFSYATRQARCSRTSASRSKPGQVAAIVGPVGHGQDDARQPDSALLRSGRPGRSRIDGTDVREYRLKSLRDQISFVLQDTLLFRATIWENIAYGKPDASPRRDQARRRAGQRAASSSRRCPRATTRWSASAASRSRAVSASASPLPARSFATRRS